MRMVKTASDIERLFGERDWMRSLARSLVGDSSQAEDLTQDTWLVAIENEQSGHKASRSWLAAVARRLAWRTHRTRARRTRRERVAARPEEVTVTPHDLLERAELQQHVASAVVALAEPYRSTIIRRYFEGVPVRDIARAENLPEATVWTRIHRALHHLRRKLDREYGGNRSAWHATLLPLAGLNRVPGEVGGSVSLSQAPTTATSAASVAQASSTAALSGGALSSSAMSVTLGGIVMTQKALLSSALVGTLALALGFATGTVVTPRAPTEEQLAKTHVPRGAYEAYEKKTEQLETEVARLRAARDAAVEAEAVLASRVSELSRKLEESSTQPEEVETVVAPRKEAPVAFGKFSELDPVREADWEEMAGAVEQINELLEEVVLLLESGEIPDAELQEKIAAENAKLVRYYGQIAGKIPTNAPINGEFSHPVTSANLVATLLERGGAPLSTEQAAELSRLGEEFDVAYERLQKAYEGDIPKLSKVIDELELKRDCHDELLALLTPEQRALVVRPKIHKRVQLDTLSPATMATLIAKPTQLGSSGQIRDRIERILRDEYKIAEPGVGSIPRVVDQWCEDLRPILEESRGAREPIHLDDAVLAGRAQAKALESLLRLPELSEKSRGAILSTPSWHVPRCVPSKAGDG